MMKKLLSILLALLMLVTLVGCSGDNSNQNSEVEELKSTIAEQEALIESNYELITKINNQIDEALTSLGYSLDYQHLYEGLDVIIDELEKTKEELYEAERKLEEYETK